MAAKRAVAEIQLLPDLLVDGLRDANRAGLGERLKPSGDVDAIAKYVVAIDDNIAKIDTDSQLETAFGRDRFVNGKRCPLHLEGAVQRVHHARKVRQHAVACGADDPSTLRRYQRVYGAAEPSKCLMGACFVLTHEAAESHHIGMQDRGKLPLLGGSLLTRLRLAIGRGSQADLTSM